MEKSKDRVVLNYIYFMFSALGSKNWTIFQSLLISVSAFALHLCSWDTFFGVFGHCDPRLPLDTTPFWGVFQGLCVPSPNSSSQPLCENNIIKCLHIPLLSPKLVEIQPLCFWNGWPAEGLVCPEAWILSYYLSTDFVLPVFRLSQLLPCLKVHHKGLVSPNPSSPLICGLYYCTSEGLRGSDTQLAAGKIKPTLRDKAFNVSGEREGPARDWLSTVKLGFALNHPLDMPVHLNLLFREPGEAHSNLHI